MTNNNKHEANCIAVLISYRPNHVLKIPVVNVDNKEFNNTTKFKYIPKPFKEPEPY